MTMIGKGLARSVRCQVGVPPQHMRAYMHGGGTFKMSTHILLRIWLGAVPPFQMTQPELKG